MRLHTPFVTFALCLALSAQAPPTAKLHSMLSGTPEEPPVLLHVGAVAPDILALDIQAGRMTMMRQVSYRAEPGDVVKQSVNPRSGEARDMRVTRNGVPLGFLIGRERNVLVVYDQLIGRPLDTAVADRPGSYVIHSAGDPAYAQGLAPVAVWRKSKSNNWSDSGPDHTTRHSLYLETADAAAPAPDTP